MPVTGFDGDLGVLVIAIVVVSITLIVTMMLDRGAGQRPHSP